MATMLKVCLRLSSLGQAWQELYGVHTSATWRPTLQFTPTTTYASLGYMLSQIGQLTRF